MAYTWVFVRVASAIASLIIPWACTGAGIAAVRRTLATPLYRVDDFTAGRESRPLLKYFSPTATEDSMSRDSCPSERDALLLRHLTSNKRPIRQSH